MTLPIDPNYIAMYEQDPNNIVSESEGTRDPLVELMAKEERLLSEQEVTYRKDAS